MNEYELLDQNRTQGPLTWRSYLRSAALRHAVTGGGLASGLSQWGTSTQGGKCLEATPDVRSEVPRITEWGALSGNWQLKTSNWVSGGWRIPFAFHSISDFTKALSAKAHLFAFLRYFFSRQLMNMRGTQAR